MFIFSQSPSIEASLEGFRNPLDILNRYFSLLVHRNKQKYASYVRAMKMQVWILMLASWRVSQAINYQYAWLRIVDDRIDGDMDLIDTDILWYAEKRFHILNALARPDFSPETPEDTLLQETLRIARENGKEMEIKQSIQMILESMIFDAKRIKRFRETGRLEFLPREELEQHFYNLDIVGTGIGMLVYLGSKNIAEDLKKLHNIGRACRIEYNLNDFVEDIEHGILNISHEDAEKYRITESDLVAVRDAPIVRDIDPRDPAKVWYQDISEYPTSIIAFLQDQVEQYDNHIKIFLQEEYMDFPLMTRVVFRQFYLNPTGKNIWKFRMLLPS